MACAWWMEEFESCCVWFWLKGVFGVLLSGGFLGGNFQLQILLYFRNSQLYSLLVRSLVNYSWITHPSLFYMEFTYNLWILFFFNKTRLNIVWKKYFSWRKILKRKQKKRKEYSSHNPSCIRGKNEKHHTYYKPILLFKLVYM